MCLTLHMRVGRATTPHGSDRAVSAQQQRRAITGLDNIVLGSALDMSAPETMWEVSEGVSAPRLSAAQNATGPARADQAFDLTMAGFLGHCRGLLTPDTGLTPRRTAPRPHRARAG